MRQLLSQKPWIGIVACVALLGGAAFMLTRGSGGSPYSVERLTADVTVVFSDTGEEVKMPRGRFEVFLWDRAGEVKLEEGIPNPKTGKLTGFPKDRGEWEETVKRINAAKAERSAPK